MAKSLNFTYIICPDLKVGAIEKPDSYRALAQIQQFLDWTHQ